MEYISHSDYTGMLKNFGKETPKGLLKEALDPVGKEDGDVNNDGKKDKTDKYLMKRRGAIGKAMGKMDELGDFSSVRARYPNNDGPFEGEMEEGPRDDDDNIPAYLRMYNSDEYVQAMQDAGEDGYATHNGDFDGDDSEPEPDRWDMKDIEDSDDENRGWENMEEGGYRGNKYEALIDKLKKDGIVFNPKMTGKFTNDVMKAMTAVGYPDGEIYNSIKNDEDFIPDVRKAIKQSVKIDTGDFDDHDTDDEKQYTYSNKRGSSSRSYDDYASDMGFEEGLNAPPFKATAGTVQNVKEQAPFGLSVLSPDEQKQLREYISSVKEIKKAIQELVGKAKNGKGMMEATAAEDEKVPAARKPVYNEPSRKPKGKPGGNRTGLVMTKAEMYEGKAKNQSLEKKVKALMAKDKLNRREALEFIKAEKEHEQEKKGDEAKMSQHD